MFKGPERIRYRYFYVRLYCTGFCFQANIVEEDVLLSALSDIFAGLKRTWNKKLNLAITGFMLLTFMITHPFQLHIADTEQYFLRHPGLVLLTFMTTHLSRFLFADAEQYFLRHPGLVLLTFMTTHLSRFLFADAEQYWLITLTFFRNH